MGNGQPDDSRQVVTGQQPALNTTKLVVNQLNQTDVVLHIGDISYARGYASVVRNIISMTVMLFILDCLQLGYLHGV